MLIAARTPVQVGIVPWPGVQVVTVIVKRTFDLVPRGVGGPSQDQDPLRLDVRAGDVVHHPSDFAPTKSLCDVVVVGGAVTDGVGPVRIVIEPLRKLGEHGGRLAARAGVGRDGDPTDASVGAGWTTPAFDFELFQCAPRDQRVPPLALPLELVVDHGDVRLASRIEGPAPEAVVLDQSGWTAPALVALRADLVAIDPGRRRVGIVWRGVVSLPEGIDPLVAVEVAAPIRSLSPRDMLRWPRAEAVEPSILRRLAAFGAASRGPRGTVSMEVDDDTAESTLTLEVKQAVVAPAVAQQGPLRPADVEAHTLHPDQLGGVPLAAAPMPSGAAPHRGLVEPLPPTRISQLLSSSDVEAALAARGAAELGRFDTSHMRAVEPVGSDLDGPTPTTARDPRGTIPDGAPATEPRPSPSPALPFAPAPPEPGPRARDTIPPTGEDLEGTVSIATRARAERALPFVRVQGDTRPLSDPREGRGSDDPETLDPLVATTTTSASASPVLPFRSLSSSSSSLPAPIAAPPPPDAEEIGTGTVTLDVKSVLAILGQGQADPRTAGGPSAAVPATPFEARRAAPGGSAAPPAPPPPPGPAPAAPVAQPPATPWAAPLGAAPLGAAPLGAAPLGAAPLAAPPLAPPQVAPVAPPPPARVEESPRAPGTGVLLGVAARLGAREAPPVAPPAAVQPPAVAPAEEKVQGISAEQFAEIKALLWSGREGRRATLSRFGLSELSWRLVEKRFAGDLARRRPEEVGAVLARLRAAVRAAPAPSAEES